MLEARPSWRKCWRSETRQRGAVLNSLPVADPCSKPSARFAPMSCSSKSEYRHAVRIAPDALAVLPRMRYDGLGHDAHPVDANNAAPADVSVASDGFGGSIVFRNATIEVSGTPSTSGRVIDAPQPLTRS